MKEEKLLRAAVIGAGNMGANHIRIYSELENVELCAVADIDEKRLSHIGKKYNINVYSDFNDLLDIEAPDIVSVTVPTIKHHKVAMEVIKRGTHLLLEKPIASTLKEAEEIIQLAKKKNVKLLIGHVERFNAAVIELKKRIKKGELGRVYKIDVNRVGPFPSQIQETGVVIDLAVHDIDIMRFLTDSEPERVYAEIEHQVHTKHEDLMSGLIRFRNKLICNLNVNWLTPTKIRKLYITGEKGMFVVNYLKQKLYFYKNDAYEENNNSEGLTIREGEMIRLKIDQKEPLLKEIEHFIECVKENKTPLVSAEDGEIALKVAMKLIEASEKRSVLKL